MYHVYIWILMCVYCVHKFYILNGTYTILDKILWLAMNTIKPYKLKHKHVTTSMNEFKIIFCNKAFTGLLR